MVQEYYKFIGDYGRLPVKDLYNHYMPVHTHRVIINKEYGHIRLYIGLDR